jgi:undecaprenyl diphosphate synthase
MSSKLSKVEELSRWDGLDRDRLPRHVAVIMDGNRRWALNRLLPGKLGHKAGVETLRETVRYCLELQIPFLTVYAFSTENWSRSDDEVTYLWDLFSEALTKEVDSLHANGVRMRFIGQIDELAPTLQEAVARAEAITAGNTKLVLNIALNYGGRREILEMVRQIAMEAKAGLLSPETLTEADLAGYSYTSGQPDPDLLIRTSGENRISNYLLWQLAYTEIHVTPTFWPDFRRSDFHAALVDFQGRQRRYGGRPDKA